jgi:hypothetical protein
MVCSIFLITDVLFTNVAAAIVAASFGGVYAVLWYLLPIVARIRSGVET